MNKCVFFFEEFGKIRFDGCPIETVGLDSLTDLMELLQALCREVCMSLLVDNPLSMVYFPTAVALGALHALEPGHAKALTAAYLIGIKGTKRDALLLGLSVASTHSLVVVGITALALWLGRETFTQDVTHWLQIGSGIIVVLLGLWMLVKRIRQMRRNRHRHQHHHHDHAHHDHAHHDHDLMSDDEHARAHAAAMPEYAKRGERPTLLQILLFGAAGGMIPCPASITVMLLALSIGQVGAGLFAVAGFSLGLALALVGIGMAVVVGISRLEGQGKLQWLSSKSPVISAGVVLLSGIFALAFAH
ncbi:nickel/cobalt efflux protein RcnA [bacterium]|nr:nickel/cobalt efflux protein RcnA [bacterium]